MAVTFTQVSLLETLRHRLKDAKNRKRKGLTLGPDEYQDLIDALDPAIELMEAERLWHLVNEK